MSKKASTAAWIAQETNAEPLRAKSLLMTLFGDAIAPHGGSIWLGSLIELMALFGGTTKPVMAHLVRTGRLTKADIHDAEQALQKYLTERKRR